VDVIITNVEKKDWFIILITAYSKGFSILSKDLMLIQEVHKKSWEIS
jgi:hypothetical protein